METNYEDHETIIAFTIGYMLKVLKNQRDISEVKFEFNSIKHGNYNEFIQLIDAELPLLVIGGDIEPVVIGEGHRSEEIIFLRNECDMIQLIASANAMKTFLEKCYLKYGNIIDADIEEITYRKLAIFEIRIRVHASNHKLIVEGDTLEKIIDKLCEKLDLNQSIQKDLHDGRRYLNKVKHIGKEDSSWDEKLPIFLKAYDHLTSKRIRLL